MCSPGVVLIGLRKLSKAEELPQAMEMAPPGVGEGVEAPIRVGGDLAGEARNESNGHLSDKKRIDNID